MPNCHLLTPKSTMLLALEILTALAAGLLLWFYWKEQQVKKRFAHIPGPPGSFLTGNWRQINRKQPFKTFLEWKQKYGNVIFITVFGKPAIIACDYDSMHEMLVDKGKEFGGRPRALRDFITLKSTGMMRMDADNRWRDIRRLVHGSVRAFGPGMARIEHYAIQMMEEFVEKFKLTEGRPIDPRDIFYDATLRMISLMVYGKKLDENSFIFLKMRSFVDRVNESFHQAKDGAQLDFFPFMRFFGNETYKTLQKASEEIDQVWDWYIKEVEPSQISDDSLGKPVAKALLDGQSSNNLRDQEIKATVIQMTFAGILTTSTIIYHLFLVLGCRPDVKKKMEEEIQKSIGERNVSISDRPKMPYVHAVILEELRFCTAGSISLAHVTLEDTTLQGYEIPKGTTCYPNVMAVHVDEEFWGDPWTFRPERFLDQDGNLVPANHPNRQSIFAFGQGPRVCVGELFAHARMFLWIVSLVQRFDIQLDNTLKPIPSYDPRVLEDIGLVFHIPSYNARFVSKAEN